MTLYIISIIKKKFLFYFLNVYGFCLLTIILLVVFAESASLVCLKKYGKGDTAWFLAAGIVGYIIVALLLLLLISWYNDIGMLNTLWSVISVLSVIIAGNVFFDEKVDGKDFAAIGVAVLSIGALQYNHSV